MLVKGAWDRQWVRQYLNHTQTIFFHESHALQVPHDIGTAQHAEPSAYMVTSMDIYNQSCGYEKSQNNICHGKWAAIEITPIVVYFAEELIRHF